MQWMRRNPKHAILSAFFMVSSGFSLIGCGSDGGVSEAAFKDQQIIVDFADRVVLPTYTELNSRADMLLGAVRGLKAATDDTSLTTAQNAWVATRVSWEQSEGFLFGPVDSSGYDPAMDSWPVNKTDLDAVLAGSATFTPEYVRNLQETQKGFHTIEYILFGEARSRTAAQLTPRQLDYLEALAVELHETTTALVTSWSTGIGSRAAYRNVFATAGNPGNTAYPTVFSAAEEIVNGMVGICTEVGTGKIADPYAAHDPNLVESQFSYNSLLDFQDNMRSVENAYLGRVPGGVQGRGLSDYVLTVEPALDARIKAEITAAIAAIGEIPAPFSTAITTPSAYPKIEMAQAKIAALQVTLERDLMAVLRR